MSVESINEAVRTLRQGGVIAYPTEAVYGLGCDPQSVESIKRLLHIKQREPEKGLILIAADFNQLKPYLAEIDEDIKQKALAVWPGPVTWVWPAKPEVSPWLRGQYNSLAVRVTAHPLVKQLCQAFGGALVSTSANHSGEAPARTAAEVREMFGKTIDYVLEGQVGGMDKPSEIRDVLSGRIIRPG